MSWIDERLKERAELQERKSLIRHQCGILFEDLWSKLRESVTEANTRGRMDVKTNGTNFERKVIISKADRSGFRQLTIALCQAEEVVRITGDTVAPIEYTIDVCDDGVICIKQNSKRVTLEDAARAILDPFFFPELQSEIT